MDAFSQLAEQGGEVLILVVLPLTIFCLAVFYLLGFSRQEMELRIKGTCFGAFGLVVGLLMGASREPVVSNTLPLLISIITVLITYLYETKADPKPAKEYLLSLLAFFFGTAFGSFYGAALRGRDPPAEPVADTILLMQGAVT